jgi:hypothetical protein
MRNLDSYSSKVMDLVGQVGDNLRDALPSNAGKWLQTGVALGAAKTGSRAVGTFVRRNPAVAVAAAVGAGMVWLAVRHHQKKQQANGKGNGNGAVIEGKSRRVEAKRAAPRTRRAGTRTRQSASKE